MPRSKSATKPKAKKASKAAAKTRKPAAAAARAKTAKTAKVAKKARPASTARRPAKAARPAAKGRKTAAPARTPKVSKAAPKTSPKTKTGIAASKTPAKTPAKAPVKAAKPAPKPAAPAKKPIPPKAGKVAALIWYEPEHYPRVVKIMSDKGDFPPTYEAWAKPARAEEETRRAEGWEIIRVSLDPNIFASWCASRGLKRNAEARRAYVRHAALARLHDQRGDRG